MSNHRRRGWRSQCRQNKSKYLILGSGQGGKLLAWQMAQSGRRTTVVERRWIGGSCPNIACMPSKNEVWSARVAYLAQHAGQFGTIAGPVETDMAAVRQRKRDMVNREIELHLQNYRASGAELVMGSGRFVAPKTLEVHLDDGSSRRLVGERVFLNVGSHAAVPAIPGLNAARPLTHIEALELDHLPPHLIVLGSGYVGLEMAQAYRRFGSRVTMIEAGPRILGREDRDIAETVQQILSDEGIQFVLAAEAIRVRGRSGEAVGITVRTAQGERTIEGSDILVATGRVPNTKALASRRPASRWMIAVTSKSTIGWRPVRPMSGRSAKAREVRSLPTSRSTISGSFATTSPAAIAAHAIGWCPTAYSPTRHSRTSD